MKGTVEAISADGGRVAVLTDYGYTVFDADAGEAFVGNVISGRLDDHGDASLTNVTNGNRFDAYVEAIQASAEAARRLLAGR